MANLSPKQLEALSTLTGPAALDVSHLIDPCSRAPRCAGYMYHGDSVAIDCEPTCPGCLNWRAQFGDDEGDVEVRPKRSWPEGWPPFAVLRRAHRLLNVTPTPSTRWLENNGHKHDLDRARSIRADWDEALAAEVYGELPPEEVAR